MNIITKEVIKLTVSRITLLMTFFIYLIFFIAYIHPEKLLVVYIDHFGEGDIEFIVLLGLIPLIIAGSWWTQADIKRQMKILEKEDAI